MDDLILLFLAFAIPVAIASVALIGVVAAIEAINAMMEMR